jgi:hypothetical protein
LAHEARLVRQGVDLEHLIALRLGPQVHSHMLQKVSSDTLQRCQRWRTKLDTIPLTVRARVHDESLRSAHPCPLMTAGSDSRCCDAWPHHIEPPTLWPACPVRYHPNRMTTSHAGRCKSPHMTYPGC